MPPPPLTGLSLIPPAQKVHPRHLHAHRDVQDRLLLLLHASCVRYDPGRHQGRGRVQGRREDPARDGAVLPGGAVLSVGAELSGGAVLLRRGGALR